jgi:hypothetical protein
MHDEDLLRSVINQRGVRRSTPKKLRQMDRVFYGCGFPHPGVECFITQISKLLTQLRMQYRIGNTSANFYGADGDRMWSFMSDSSLAVSIGPVANGLHKGRPFLI